MSANKSDFEGLSFDEASSKLEKILDSLESDAQNLTPEETEKLIVTAEKLRNYLKGQLKKEREDIMKVAKENGIPLSEIGLAEEEDDNE
jgi:exonuclease VII small subunit